MNEYFVHIVVSVCGSVVFLVQKFIVSLNICLSSCQAWSWLDQASLISTAIICTLDSFKLLSWSNFVVVLTVFATYHGTRFET